MGWRTLAIGLLGLPSLASGVACGDDGGAGAAPGSGSGSGSGGRGEGGAAISANAATGGSSAAPTTGAGGRGGHGGEATGGGGAGPVDDGPARYPGGRTHSPITATVAAGLRALSPVDARDDVFMKVGASSTVSRNTLFCFADGPVDLGAHEALAPTLAFFLGGDAAGTSPFDRESLAAESGRNAAWATAGRPSPLEEEMAAIHPRLALLHYGANDMGAGATYESALVAFHANLSRLIEEVLAAGVVPVVFGITRREDVPSADLWVGTFNAAIRGMAQRAQVPFVDLHHAIDPLPGHGLAGDGLHLEAFAGGACLLDEAGLQHGYNVRNLVALEALDRVARVLSGEVDPLDEPGPRLAGDGSAADPWQIDSFPFAHAASSEGGERLVDGYPACGDADESGPERWFRLELGEPKRLRAVVLDRDGVDVDVHLVGSAPTGDGCVARGHHGVSLELGAGTHHLAVDTFVDGGVELAGDFLLVVVECDDEDPACDP